MIQQFGRAQYLMTQQFEGGQSAAEAPPLPVYESGQHMSRSVNLNELIKLHRNKQKYEIVDRFFNNSYILIENKVQPIDVYYQCESFKSYLEDLNLVYFKDIEFNENVRLAFILRRLNYTLNGEVFDFKQYLEENKFHDEVMALFSDAYLDQLTNVSNKKSVLDLRNSLTVCLIIEEMYNYGFTNEQIKETANKINKAYQSIIEKVNEHDELNGQVQRLLQDDSHECFLNNLSSDSMEKQESACSSFDEPCDYSQKYTFWFEDLIYQQEIDLKIIQSQLEIYYLTNLIDELVVQGVNVKNYQYIDAINKEYIGNLRELREINIQCRQIIKKIKRNIKIEMMTGVRCICIQNSSDHLHCFGEPVKIDTALQLKELKMQKVMDVEFMENQLLKMINKLKLRLIADAIEKVYEIQKEDSKCGKQSELLFSVNFDHGLGIKQATFHESDFLRLNQIREESTLTSYLTPMKSKYSYISHNIYTFLKLVQKDFPYNRESNKNEEVLKNIKSKLSKCKNLGKSDSKSLYQEQFKLCHNCKILCHQDFFKQCKRRVKQFREQEEDECSDDSLYTEKNFRRKNMFPHFMECERYYCLYCIKNQFNGKIFNDKGWCPACLGNCHCNTCLREKILKKYVELYLFIGGDKDNIKNEKDIIDEMRVKDCGDEHSEEEQEQSLNETQIQERIYESVIKKEIMKGYSADQIFLSLKQQERLYELIVQREGVKLKHLDIDKTLFREKVSFLNGHFDYEEIDLDNQAERQKEEMQKERQKQEQAERLRKKREKKLMEKDSVKRKSRKVRRDEEIYYDFYRYDDVDSQIESSSFHLKQRKPKQRKYEPEFHF